ncbi:U2 small nuclear ribonucleoprotein A'-like isoform X1 [Gossypium raimondii]|uniref:U2 small nuclear ribonucleoprotein A'-like isoform X1 n=1 Tax=Gossypium raimondii TaxID=29730 RepID=UPI00227D428B|nr:U2 small nuclear ribonucleoprotein A'-like isoform X1 [Gossypium raimondii]
MVKLMADLIWKCPHFFNALKERELDLRGNKIAVIENLGATEVCITLFVLVFSAFVALIYCVPYLKRLGTLLINNNRVTRINPNIGEFLPSLHTLVLTNNRLVNLVKIDPLSSLPKLNFLRAKHTWIKKVSGSSSCWHLSQDITSTTFYRVQSTSNGADSTLSNPL